VAGQSLESHGKGNALSWRSVSAAGAVLLVAVAGCSSATIKTVSQPATSRRSDSPRPSWSQPPAFQRGIDIDLYIFPGMNAMAAGRADVQYALSLHANAVSFTFPFFMAGENAQGVYASRETPSPDVVAGLARYAQQAGLYVSIRPLLDESSLGVSRTGWKPRDITAWFASYQQFLQPYAEMAQRLHIPELIVGAEFDEFGFSSGWDGLDRALGRVYQGQLGFSRNWTVNGSQGGPVNQLVDSYPAFRGLSAGSSPAALTAAWESYDRQLPAGMVQSEVGIAAVEGAYARPWTLNWPAGTTIVPAIQAMWFTAACHAAKATGLGGIYFWSLGLGPPSGPTLAQAGAWSDSPGSNAISACFSELSRT
jgi:hypothetical protein